jgi:hypothetical protein
MRDASIIAVLAVAAGSLGGCAFMYDEGGGGLGGASSPLLVDGSLSGQIGATALAPVAAPFHQGQRIGASSIDVLIASDSEAASLGGYYGYDPSAATAQEGEIDPAAPSWTVGVFACPEDQLRQSSVSLTICTSDYECRSNYDFDAIFDVDGRIVDGGAREIVLNGRWDDGSVVSATLVYAAMP